MVPFYHLVVCAVISFHPLLFHLGRSISMFDQFVVHAESHSGECGVLLSLLPCSMGRSRMLLLIHQVLVQIPSVSEVHPLPADGSISIDLVPHFLYPTRSILRYVRSRQALLLPGLLRPLLRALLNLQFLESIVKPRAISISASSYTLLVRCSRA